MHSLNRRLFHSHYLVNKTELVLKMFTMFGAISIGQSMSSAVDLSAATHQPL